MTLLNVLGTTESVIRFRAITVDDGHGNKRTTGWDQLSISPAYVEVTGTSELIGGRSTITQTAILRVPITSDVIRDDQIQWRGNRYDVVGEPSQISHRLTPMLSRLQVSLILREG